MKLTKSEQIDPGFYDYMSENAAPKTKMNYLRSLRHLSSVQKIDLHDRQSFVDWKNTMHDSRKMFDKTINMYLKAFNFWCDFKGWPRLKPYSVPRTTKTRAATYEDYRAMRSAVLSWQYPDRTRAGVRSLPPEFIRQKDLLLLDLMFKAGLREKEISDVSVSDIQGDILTVQAGKGQKSRLVFIFPSLKGQLSRYLDLRSRVRTNSTALILNQYGEKMNEDGVRNNATRISKKAGLRFSPHMARRFYARRVYQTIPDPEALRLQMGHQSFETTQEYIKMTEDDSINALKKVANKLDFKMSLVRTVSNPGRGV